MAKPQNKKRKCADESSRVDVNYPLKKTETRSESELEIRESWENPPEFYDRLSKISLTRRALRELNRRTCARRSYRSLSAKPGSNILLGTIPPRDLVRYSRHGGPDLRDLRGYPHPPSDHPHPVDMSTSRSLRSRETRSSDPVSPPPTSTTTKSKKSSPYDRNFDLHLTEHAIHPTYRSREPDLNEVRANLANPRSSLSPCRFSDSAFKAFQKSNDQAKDEDDVLANVIPTILGAGQADRFCARNTVFNNFEPLTDGTIVAPNPDIYWGAYPEQLARPARNELASHIMPSTMKDKPIAPNCFIEVKGPDGSLAVASRQARYIGASGSRGMHSLQNYGIGEPHYDGQPYTFTAIYHGGQLQLYAHHITAPTIEGGRPEYHMTQVDAWGMTGNRRTFVEGASAFRNTLELAEKYRGNFIEDANARASQTKPVTNRDRTNIIEIPQREDLAAELAPSSPYYAAQLQHGKESPDGFSPTQHISEGDDSQDLPGINPSTTFTTSFTSSFGPYQSRLTR